MNQSKAGSEIRVLLVVLFLALCGIATATMLLLNGTTEYLSPMKGIHFWSISSQALSAQSSEDKKAVDENSTNSHGEILLKAIRNFHHREASTQTSGDRQNRATAREQLQLEIRRYIETRGVEDYVKLGLVVRDKVLEKISRVVDQSHNEQQDLLTWVQTHPDNSALSFIRDHSGELLQWGVKAGLLGPQFANSEEHRFILATMYKVRWLQRAEFIASFDDHVSKLERIAILVFQVEFESDLSIDARLAHLDQVEKLLPTYPTNIMRIVLHYRAGDLDQARELLAAAAKETPAHPSLNKLRSLIDTTQREQ